MSAHPRLNLIWRRDDYRFVRLIRVNLALVQQSAY